MDFEIRQGINIGDWLCWTDMSLKERIRWLTEEDIERIVEMGFDHVRVAIHEKNLWNELGSPIPAAFDLLHWGLERFLMAGLRVVVNMHVLRSHFFGQKDEPALFTDPVAEELFIQIWQQLSETMQSYPAEKLAYEFLNEPIAGQAERWNEVSKRIYSVLRAREPERFLVLGSNRQQSPHTFHQLAVPSDPKMILDFHFYEPDLVTHYRSLHMPTDNLPMRVRYPGRPLNIPAGLYAAVVKVLPGLTPTERKMALDENRVYDQNSMRQVLAEPVEVARRAGVPLHCGEFGVIAKLPTDLGQAWMTDVLSIYRELHIGWTYWSYTRDRDNFGILNLDGSEKPIASILRNLMR
jgi:endoglucanase